MAALVLLFAAQGAAAVRKVSFTATVSPSDYARLQVAVAPVARCTITVIYDTGESEARGLGPKRGGSITWRWRVGSTTNPGRWPIRVDCGKSGRLTIRLRVLP
jgi:micrococcal nuclease